MIDVIINFSIALMTVISVYGVIVSIVSTIQSHEKEGGKRQKVVSSDGHTIKKEEDLTCARFGHKHEPMPKEYGERYVVHNDPETGEVVLDGVKRKIKDCGNI